MCFVWIWEQTAIISLYSINWLVFITDGMCLLRGTDWIYIDGRFMLQEARMSSSVHKFAYVTDFLERKLNDKTLFCSNKQQ